MNSKDMLTLPVRALRYAVEYIFLEWNSKRRESSNTEKEERDRLLDI